MRRFLIGCGGFDYDTAVETGETGRLAAIGALVLLPTALAAVAFPYWLIAMLRVDSGTAMLFAPFAGLVVFAIDRAVVSLVVDGGFWKRTALFVARLALSIGIGFAIAEPLVLRVFQPEVDAALAQDFRVASRNATKEVNEHSPEAVDRAKKQAELDRRKNDISDAASRTSAAFGAWEAEGKGTGGSHTAGFRQLAAERYREYEAARQAEAALRLVLEPEMRSLDSSIRELDEALATKATGAAKQIERSDGVLARHEALDRLTSASRSAAMLRWGVTALLVLIDVVAVLVKTLAGVGAYEARVLARRRALALENEAFLRAVEHEPDLGRDQFERFKERPAPTRGRRRLVPVAGVAAALVAAGVSTSLVLSAGDDSIGRDGHTTSASVAAPRPAAAAADVAIDEARAGVLAAADAKPGSNRFCAEMTKSAALRDLRADVLDDDENTSRVARRAAAALTHMSPPATIDGAVFQQAAKALTAYARDPNVDSSVNTASAALTALGREVQPLCDFPLG